MEIFGLGIGGPIGRVMSRLKALSFRESQDLTFWPFSDADICAGEPVPYPFSRRIVSLIMITSQRSCQHQATVIPHTHIWCRISDSNNGEADRNTTGC